MKGDYFKEESNKNKNILVSLMQLVWNGLVIITSLRIDKNMTGGYRLTMFFNRKDEE